MLEGASRWLLVVAGLQLAVAVGAHARAEVLRGEAAQAARQSREAGLAFSESLEGDKQDSELRLLDQRRELVGRTLRWQATGVVSFAFALVSLLAAWVFRELVRAGFEEELDEDGLPRPRR